MDCEKICAPIMDAKWLIEESSKRIEDILKSEIKRVEQLQVADIRRIDERITRYSDHFKELATAEAKRIDAIRSVDVAAVVTASDKVAQQAVVLANQVNTSAETLMTLVAATATTVAAQLQQLSTQLTDRLTTLEKAQYESGGRSGVSAPLLMAIAAFAGGLITFIAGVIMKTH